ncbi:MAG: OmpH family outer membrane protein [Burkholderiales bacterium]
MLLKMTVLFGASLCVLSSAQAQEKIGYISSQRIVNEALPYKAASAKLEQEFSKRAKDLHDMETRLKDMQDKLEKDGPILSESDRSKRQRDLFDLNKEGQRKQRELQEDLSQRRNEELATVLDRVNKVISQIAESEKYDIVIQDALYHSARVDITDKVLKILNKP